MANPPITIGPFANVPAPGSPMRSDWPQQISHWVTEDMTYRRARLTATDDASLTSTLHGFQVGPTGGANIIMDGNEIVSRNNGAADRLYLNDGSGSVVACANAPAGTLVTGATPDPTGNQVGVQSHVNGTIFAVNGDTNANVRLTKLGTAGVGEQFVRFGRLTSDTGIGSITIASATSVAFNTTSDPRLKESEGPIGDAADRVRALGAAAFRGRWIGDEGAGEVWDFLSSHDVEAAAPYAVHGARDAVESDGTIIPQQVDYSALVPLLCAALADALDRIAALEAAP